ncbi:MAG: hypothetical protein LR015_01190 [Verrucomicrobia bacterium]|nr:hypothetical protein [Verrucomicrobiota bacterium]
MEALKRLDAAASDPTATLPPRLQHFLQNRSYQKALLFITGQETPLAQKCGQHDELKG